MYDRNENLTSDLSNYWFYFDISSFLLPSRWGRSFEVFFFFFFFPRCILRFLLSRSFQCIRSYIQVNRKLGSDGKWLNILFRIVIARSTDALVQSSQKRLITIKFVCPDRFERKINAYLVSIFFFFLLFLLISLIPAPLPHLSLCFSLFSSTQSLRAKFLPRLIINSLTCHKNKYFYHIA